jgi:hypothetical protein
LVFSRLGHGLAGSAVAVLLGSIAGLVALAAVASRWHVEEFRELTAALRGRGAQPAAARAPARGPVRGPAGPVGRVPLRTVPADRRGRSSGGKHRAR